MNNVFLSGILIISATLLGTMAVYAAKRRNLNGAVAFSMLVAAMSIHSMGYALELLGNTLDNMYLWIRVEYLGISFYPFLIMLFARESSDEKRIANRYVLKITLIVSVVTLVIVNTNQYHGLYYASVGVDSSLGFNALSFERGIWYYVNAAAICCSNVYGIAVFWIKFKNSAGAYRKRAFLMIAGMFVPLATFMIYTWGGGPACIDIMPFSYAVMGFLIGVGLFRYDILFLSPVTHETILNSIDEAVLVMDECGMLISVNSSSKRLFPSIERLKTGEPVGRISELADYRWDCANEVYQIKGRSYSFRVIQMDRRGGRIYVVKDVTEEERAKRQLEILATTDTLTGLYNRRHFMEHFESGSEEGAFAIIDIDHFKSINDTFGHVKGDEVLEYFAGELKSFFQGHMLCRYGGEEFALIMQGFDAGMAFEKIDSFRSRIADGKKDVGFTFSAGVAEYKRESIQKSIVEADRMLYKAKESGRNRVRY